MEHHLDSLSDDRTARISQLNDAYRATVPYSPDLALNTNVAELLGDFLSDLWRAIRDFDAFTEDNDPWEEHDFGCVKVRGTEVWWKIDSYDKNLEYGSPDSSDSSVTRRVMTIYLPQDH